ncbi:hypothetical protein B0H13DRAFT_1876294 [Mycena leptocephala]|nr:hypothetical protein B0H13DRAFT_1876294 [Mycena leptocephala]
MTALAFFLFFFFWHFFQVGSKSAIDRESKRARKQKRRRAGEKERAPTTQERCFKLDRGLINIQTARPWTRDRKRNGKEKSTHRTARHDHHSLTGRAAGGSERRKRRFGGWKARMLGGSRLHPTSTSGVVPAGAWVRVGVRVGVRESSEWPEPEFESENETKRNSVGLFHVVTWRASYESESKFWSQCNEPRLSKLEDEDAGADADVLSSTNGARRGQEHGTRREERGRQKQMGGRRAQRMRGKNEGTRSLRPELVWHRDADWHEDTDVMEWTQRDERNGIRT